MQERCLLPHQNSFRLGYRCFCGPGPEETWEYNKERPSHQHADAEWDNLALSMISELPGPCLCQQLHKMCARPWTNDRPFPISNTNRARTPAWARATPSNSATPLLGSPLPSMAEPMCRRRTVLPVHHNIQASCITCI